MGISGLVAAPRRPRSRRIAFEAAMEPLVPAVQALDNREVLVRLAAALPREDEWRVRGAARWNGLDRDLNAAMAPLRWHGLYAAERAGAASELSPCDHAIWNWEVRDATWRAALDAIDVAMAVTAHRVEGVPVTDGMEECHRRVLAVACNCSRPSR